MHATIALREVTKMLRAGWWRILGKFFKSINRYAGMTPESVVDAFCPQIYGQGSARDGIIVARCRFSKTSGPTARGSATRRSTSVDPMKPSTPVTFAWAGSEAVAPRARNRNVAR